MFSNKTVLLIQSGKLVVKVITMLNKILGVENTVVVISRMTRVVIMAVILSIIIGYNVNFVTSLATWFRSVFSGLITHF